MRSNHNPATPPKRLHCHSTGQYIIYMIYFPGSELIFEQHLVVLLKNQIQKK